MQHVGVLSGLRKWYNWVVEYQEPGQVRTAVSAEAFKAPPAGGLRLVVTSGPDRGQKLDLQPGVFVVGTGSDCALQLSDPFISRQHLEFAMTPDGLKVRDLESRNGSFYGGARFDSIRLSPGTSVVIGETELKVVRAEGGALTPSPVSRFGDLVGGSTVMRQVFAALERLAASDSGVLIQGETGTGKELAAEAIHRTSARKSEPFVVCDLAGLSPSSIEAELFGHQPDAGQPARPGTFMQAQGGDAVPR